MKLPVKYIPPESNIAIIIESELEMLEGDFNEIYFYTTIENARDLSVGYRHLINGREVLIGSVQTRLSMHLPHEDGRLFPHRNIDQCFTMAIQNFNEYQWGVLVSGELVD